MPITIKDQEIGERGRIKFTIEKITSYYGYYYKFTLESPYLNSAQEVLGPIWKVGEDPGEWNKFKGSNGIYTFDAINLELYQGNLYTIHIYYTPISSSARRYLDEIVFRI